MTILQKIFATKRAELDVARLRVSPSEMRARANDSPPRKGFIKALQGSPNPIALIAEVKKASPSQGLIVNGEFDPVAIAQAYEQVGADCLSVLTDEQYFGGSLSYLTAVRSAVNLPLLRKDFVFDPYQIDEAIVAGADCILLIVAGIDRSALFDCYAYATNCGLDVLVEVHNEAEAAVAAELNPRMVGINNRDLATFEVDIETTERLIGLLPKQSLKVSESALHAYEDVVRVRSYGANAVLIGTAFCESPDIAVRVREVMNW
ncbi:MAG TPA: indole-3-glycerol phosphate synthase TrpC [Fimbriimonas sp.]|nr:indole-3-glycerol phosphate synthase TrpC [Fimbriimonas sp.]